MGLEASASHEDVKSAGELHAWNKRVLSIGGMWPLEPSYLKFYMSYVYFVVHGIFAIGDLVSVLGDISQMIENLLVTAVEAMVGVKMMVLRHSSLLEKVLNEVLLGVNENNYRDKKEMKLYLAYNRIGKTFFQISSFMCLATCGFYHIKPLEDILNAVFRNGTIPSILPYRTRLFFNISDTGTYTLLYLLQTPMFYYHYFHTMSICFLCTLIIHVAGEMSVLAHRIRAIKSSDVSMEYYSNAFREVIRKHYKIIWTATAIDDIFNVVLLEELVISTILLGLTSYSLLSKPFMESISEYFFIINYIAALLVVILVYCIIGEYLVQESANVQNAYYECQWYKMPSKYRKYMIICMARLQNPLQLTAGRFYVFSLSRFNSVLKTAMAYISMLRAIS